MVDREAATTMLAVSPPPKVARGTSASLAIQAAHVAVPMLKENIVPYRSSRQVSDRGSLLQFAFDQASRAANAAAGAGSATRLTGPPRPMSSTMPRAAPGSPLRPAIDDALRRVRDLDLLMRSRKWRVEWPRSDGEAAWLPGGRWTPAEVRFRAERARGMYENFRQRGRNGEQAAGWAANVDAESGSNYRQNQDPEGPGQGLMQWEAPRRALFEQVNGHPMSRSTEREQLDFIDWELANNARRNAQRIPNSAPAGEIADAIMNHYAMPRERTQAGIDRANLAEAIRRLDNSVRLAWPLPRERRRGR